MVATKINAQEIADKYNISKGEVENIYHDTFEFIHDIISSLDFTTLTNDEIDQMKTSFVIPELGKLYLDKERLHKYLKLWKKI